MNASEQTIKPTEPDLSETNLQQTTICGCCDVDKNGSCYSHYTRINLQVRSLRFVVATFIIVFAIVTAFVMADTIIYYSTIHIRRFGVLYMQTFTEISKADISAIFQTVTDDALTIVDQLRSYEDFRLPSEDPTFNASSKLTQPFRMVLNYAAFDFVNFGFFIDDGSALLASKQFFNGATSGSTEGSLTGEQQLERATELVALWSAATTDGNYSNQLSARSQTATVFSMASTFNTSQSGKTTVTHLAQYSINGSEIPTTNLIAADFSEDDTDHFPDFYNISKSFHSSAETSDKIGWSANPIVLKLSEQQEPFLNLAFNVPVYNNSGYFMGFLGAALDTEILSSFLLVATRKYATVRTVGMILDSSLAIYASTLPTEELPYYEKFDIPLGDALPDPQRCQRSSANIAALGTETTVLCVKDVFNYNFNPSAEFFRKYPYERVENPPGQPEGTVYYRSSLFDTTPSDYVYVTQWEENVQYQLYYCSFVKLATPNSERSVPFEIAVAFFTHIDDFHAGLFDGLYVMVGVVLGAIIVAFIVTMVLVTYWLKRLPSVTAKMVKTSELMFDDGEKRHKKHHRHKGTRKDGSSSTTTAVGESSIHPSKMKLNTNLMKIHDSQGAQTVRVKPSFTTFVEVSSEKQQGEREKDQDEFNSPESARDSTEQGIESSSVVASTANATTVTSAATSNIDDSNFSSVAEIYTLECAQVSLDRSLQSMSKYLTKDVVRLLQLQGASALLTSSKLSLQRKNATVLCSDIVSFTSLSESVDSSLLSELLALYFDKVVGAISDHGGTVLLFVGDAVIAGWSVVFESLSGNDEMRAALCALEMQRVVATEPLKGVWKTKVQKKLNHRIGINAGEVFAGVTGCSHRMTYSVSGPNYDFAGWLEAAGKKFGTLTSVSESVAQKIDTLFCMRRLMPVEVNGTLFAERQVPEQAASPSSSVEDDFEKSNNSARGMKKSDSSMASLDSSSSSLLQDSSASSGSGRLNKNLKNNNSNMYSGRRVRRSSSVVAADMGKGSVWKTFTNVYELLGLVSIPNLDNNRQQMNGGEKRSRFSQSSRYRQIREFLSVKLPSDEVNASGGANHHATNQQQQQTLSKLSSFNRNFLKAHQHDDEEDDSDVSPAEKKIKRSNSGSFITGNPLSGFDLDDAASNVQSEEADTSSDDNERSFREQQQNGDDDDDDESTTLSQIIDATEEEEDDETDSPRKKKQQKKKKKKDNNDPFLGSPTSANNTPLIDLFTRSYLHRRASLVVSEVEMLFADDFSSGVSLFANGQPREALEKFEQIQQDPSNSIFFYVPSTKAEMHEKLFGGKEKSSGSGIARTASANIDAEQMKQEEEIRVALEEQDETFRERMFETIEMPNRCSSCFITAHKSLKLIQSICESKFKEMERHGSAEISFNMCV